jgi:hypothetical protein
MKNIWVKRLVYGVIGGAGGFAYYTFVGCVTGSCPITSNPYLSTAYGAMIGLVMTFSGRRKNQR